VDRVAANRDAPNPIPNCSSYTSAYDHNSSHRSRWRKRCQWRKRWWRKRCQESKTQMISAHTLRRQEYMDRSIGYRLGELGLVRRRAIRQCVIPAHFRQRCSAASMAPSRILSRRDLPVLSVTQGSLPPSTVSPHRSNELRTKLTCRGGHSERSLPRVYPPWRAAGTRCLLFAVIRTDCNSHMWRGLCRAALRGKSIVGIPAGRSGRSCRQGNHRRCARCQTRRRDHERTAATAQVERHRN
jgi:hypothetical protein